MVKFVPIDLNLHKSIILDLNHEYLTWIEENIKLNYNLDLVSILGQSIREYAEKMVEELSSYRLPDGEFYVVKNKGIFIGMGAFRRLKGDTGEIKRMFIKPEFRGKGFGKILLNYLINMAKKSKYSEVLIDTGKFMISAQHLYRSAGFQETQLYPETEVPPEMQPYWIYMIKKLDK
jgi:ribosomal protein S18 acetylase RimI-like enzyme